MDPLRWAGLRGTRLHPYWLTILLQNQLRNLLNSYLNGYTFDRASAYLFPRIKRTPTANHDDLLASIHALSVELQEVYDPLPTLPQACQCTQPEFIAAAYRLLESLIGRVSLRTEARRFRAASMYSRDEYDMRDPVFLRPVVNLMSQASRIAGLWSRFFLHGSLATLDYERGFSDLDTFVVLRREHVVDPQLLPELQRTFYPLTSQMYCTDPLQHHGFFFVTEIDLQYYPETYFPLTLLDHAKALGDNENISIRIRPSFLEARRSVWDILQYLRVKFITNAGSFRSLYELKLFLSYVLLLPALFLQATGRPTYKRFSFDLASQELGPLPGIVATASELRRSLFPWSKWLTGLPPAAWVPPQAIRKFGQVWLDRVVDRRVLHNPLLLEQALSFAEDLFAVLMTRPPGGPASCVTTLDFPRGGR
jgi:hypothetical protein